MICGGTISGNCASGRPRIAMSPAMTVTMAMTIATMGRLMKKFEMFIRPSLRRRCGRSVRVRLRVDRRAGSDFLRALCDDRLARLQALLDDPHRLDALADLDGAEADLVVAAHDGDLIAALQLRDGALRDEERLLPHAGHGAHAAVLTRAQSVPGIREDSREPDRARLLVHLPVGDEEPSALRI